MARFGQKQEAQLTRRPRSILAQATSQLYLESLGQGLLYQGPGWEPAVLVEMQSLQELLLHQVHGTPEPCLGKAEAQVTLGTGRIPLTGLGGRLLLLCPQALPTSVSWLGWFQVGLSRATLALSVVVSAYRGSPSSH